MTSLLLLTSAPLSLVVAVAAPADEQVHGGAILTLVLVFLFGFVLCAKRGIKEPSRGRGFRRLEEDEDHGVQLSGVIKD